MKIGEFEIKRHYSTAQKVIDMCSAFMLFLLIRMASWYVEMVFDPQQSRLIYLHGDNIPFHTWGYVFVFPILGVIAILLSILFTFKKKSPKKYKLTEKTAQSYSNIVNDCIYMIRLVVLIALFEFIHIYNDIFYKNNFKAFNMTLLFDLCFVIIIILYTRFRLKNLFSDEPKKYISNKK